MNAERETLSGPGAGRKLSRHLPVRFAQMLRSNLRVARWYKREFGESSSLRGSVRVAWMDARRRRPNARARVGYGWFWLRRGDLRQAWFSFRHGIPF